MAKIEVKDIKPNGAELFDDSEGFMDKLNEDVLEQLNGGMLKITDPLPQPGYITTSPWCVPTLHPEAN